MRRLRRPLAHNAPRCVRCKVRYCDSTCQHDHWRRGHKQMCKKIHRGGNAEQYNADKKYKEAVAEAVEACADDTKGQTCYICTQALHWKTKEGLVRMCACRGTSGFAHVSCLAEQAKILVAEAEENNLDDKALDERWARWYSCRICEQDYHGVVACALGWACWKTYLGRPEADWARGNAMTQLGNGLYDADHYEDALTVREARLSVMRRLGATEGNILAVQGNLADTYDKLGRSEEALRIYREVYAARLRLHGPREAKTLHAASNLSDQLCQMALLAEAKQFLSEQIPLFYDVCGTDDLETIKMRWRYAGVLSQQNEGNHTEAVATLEDVVRRCRRILGNQHPLTARAQNMLELSRRGTTK